MPAASKSAKKSIANKNNFQVVLLVGVLLVLLFVSVGSTLIVTGVFDASGSRANSKPITYIYDAQLLCDQHIRDKFTNRLKAAFVDDFSSRLDESTGIYKMFYEVSVKRDVNEAAGVDTYFLNCFITGTGRLKTLTYSKDRLYKPKSNVRTSAHPFGL